MYNKSEQYSFCFPFFQSKLDPQYYRRIPEILQYYPLVNILILTSNKYSKAVKQKILAVKSIIPYLFSTFPDQFNKTISYKFLVFPDIIFIVHYFVVSFIV